MIKLITQGTYRIVGTADHKMILYLGRQGYHWGYAPGIGYLLTFSKHYHKTKYQLARGQYKLFSIKDEPHLIDLMHLELSVGKGKWQSYLLLTGLPTSEKIRSRIEPTKELVALERGW